MQVIHRAGLNHCNTSLTHSLTHSLNRFKYDTKISNHADLSAVIANEVKTQMIEFSKGTVTDKSQYPPGTDHSLTHSFIHSLTHSF